MPLIKITKYAVNCDSCGSRASITKTNHYNELTIRYWRCRVCGESGKAVCVSMEHDSTENDPTVVEFNCNDGDPAHECTGNQGRASTLENHTRTERE